MQRTSRGGGQTLAWAALLGSRLLVWGGALAALGWVGRRTLTVARFDPHRLTLPFHAAWANFVLAPAARWDTVWYLGVAHGGYASRQSTAFFPLYPLLLSVARGYGAELVLGWVISMLAATIGVALLYRLARLDLPERSAVMTIVLLVVFPTSLFLSAVYTEPLFLALSVGAVYAARLDHWGVACALGALSGATRPNGILIAVPLTLIYLYGPRQRPPATAGAGWRPRYALERSALWLLLIPAGLLAYLAYLWVAHGSPLEPFAAEHLWRRSFAGPFGAVVKLIAVLPHDVHLLFTHRLHLDDYGSHDFFDVLFLAFAAGGLWLSWQRLPRAYFAYALVFLAQTLSEPFASEPLASFSRYLLVIFPLFMAWGDWLAERRAVARVALIGAAGLLVAVSAVWGTWRWVA